MTEESAEAPASKRPGENADLTTRDASQEGGNGRSHSQGKSRRRPRNRKRKGIQAEKDSSSHAVASGQRDDVAVSQSAGPDHVQNGVSGGPENSANSRSGAVSNQTTHTEKNSDGSVIPKDNRGKRARRRRKRGKQNSKQSANHSTVEPALNAPAEAAEVENQSRSKRRRTRRPGRKDKAPVAAIGRFDESNSPVVNHQSRPKPGTRNSNNARQGSAQRTTSQTKRNQANQPQSSRNPGRADRRPMRQREAYAALDLGTNNCRLLVAVPQQPGRFKVVDAFSRIVRLGEGLAGSGRLNDQAMDRAVEALKACANKLTNRSIKNVRLIATEACRRASNGAEFLNRVERESGLQLEIVDRETEARLAVAGCSSLVDRKAKGVVLFDIGGGSSELALLDLRKRRRHDLSPALVSWTSLPHGVVTLSEKHGGGKNVTPEIFNSMVDEVSELLFGFDGKDELQEASSEGEVHLLGTSGTVTTLAGIHLELPRYDRNRVDGTWMVSSQVEKMIDTLVRMDFEERVKNPCIGRDRADLVLAGCAILVAIQNLWPCPRLRVADRGLREGLLTEMMNADNAWQRRRPQREKR